MTIDIKFDNSLNWGLVNGDVATTSTIEGSIIAQLFTITRISKDLQKNVSRRSGWIGQILYDGTGFTYGSDLENYLAQQNNNTIETSVIKNKIQTALKSLLDDNTITKLDIKEVEIIGSTLSIVLEYEGTESNSLSLRLEI